MACCPFHADSRPSFGVNTVTGTYNCFGCGAKGTFAQLVKELDNFDTVYDAEEYLQQMYGRYVNIDEPLDITFNEDAIPEKYSLPVETLDPYKFRHPYLTKRGITEKYQRAFKIGYSKDKQAVTIPWFDHMGNLISIKMRRVYGKAFWFEPPMPKRVKACNLYGLDKVIRWDLRQVAITEGEIDCLSVWQAEIGCVALGGNRLSDEQADLLVKVLPEDSELIIITDNDSGGQLAKETIINKLSCCFSVSSVDWSLVTGNPKDANDVSTDEIKKLIKYRKSAALPIHFN